MEVKYPHFDFNNPSICRVYTTGEIEKEWLAVVDDTSLRITYSTEKKQWFGSVAVFKGEQCVWVKECKLYGECTKENFDVVRATVESVYIGWIAQYHNLTDEDIDEQELKKEQALRKLKEEKRKLIRIKVGNDIALCLSISALIINLISLLKK